MSTPTIPMLPGPAGAALVGIALGRADLELTLRQLAQASRALLCHVDADRITAGLLDPDETSTLPDALFALSAATMRAESALAQLGHMDPRQESLPL